MNIRIMGSPDLVLAWKEELEEEYKVSGKVYANRGGSPDIRVYFNIDDRLAEKILTRPSHPRGMKPNKALE